MGCTAVWPRVPWLAGGDGTAGNEPPPQPREFMEGGTPLCHAVPIWGAVAVTGHLSLYKDRWTETLKESKAL